ncbi:MAG: MotA/TolQ/ExbB proton channel family protein [Bdellovibrionales bacterium]|nr:MotA/TolQ/ExbB proton channel family protein [Bdellovibrionales bacterium]
MGDFVEIFREGGIWMYLILVIGVFSLAIFLERLVVLYTRSSVDKERFIGEVQRAILAGDLNSAVNYCNNRSAPLNNIVKAGLIAVMNKGKDDEIQTSMDVAALREVPNVERRTPFLALFGNIATLIGLLATISGLISSFRAVASVDPAQKAALLSRGIAEAMHGTAFGLIVAIPALLGYALLSAKTQKIVDDIHEVSVSTLNLIIQNRERFPARN